MRMLVHNPTALMSKDQKLDQKQMRLLNEVMKLSSSKPAGNFMFDMRDASDLFRSDLPVDSVLPESKQTSNVSSSKSGRDNFKSSAPTVPVTPSASLKNPGRAKRTPSPKQEPPTTNAGYSTEGHFSGSAFESAPDASELPMPCFDEELPSFFATESSPQQSSAMKSEALRQFLKVRKP